MARKNKKSYKSEIHLIKIPEFPDFIYKLKEQAEKSGSSVKIVKTKLFFILDFVEIEIRTFKSKIN